MNDPVKPPWVITPEKVEQAIRRLAEAGRPRKIILFGFYLRGETHRDSDLDVLVVVDDSVADPRQESARWRSLLRWIRMLIDIIVVRESDLRIARLVRRDPEVLPNQIAFHAQQINAAPDEGP